MNKACFFAPALALAASMSFATDQETMVREVEVDPMIHIESKQFSAAFGKEAYRISLSPVAKQDYKILGLIKPSDADAAAYSAFVYCALRKVAIDRGFEYWLLLPSRSADSGYVGYVRTEADAKYIAEKSLKRLKIHSVHTTPATTNGCAQSY